MLAKKTRLLVMTTSFPNRHNPASGLFVRRLLENLPQVFTPTVVTPDSERRAVFDSDVDIKIKPFRYAPRKLQVLAHRPGGLPAILGGFPLFFILLPGFCLKAVVAMFIEARHSDLIHAQWAPNGLIAGLAGILFKRPVVTTLRGTDFHWARSSAFFRMVIRWCLRLNQRIIVVNHEMVTLLSAWFPQHWRKIQFIPNGVDIPENGFNGKEPVATFTVVVISSLIPAKKVEVVIHSLARLTQHGLNARLLVVGDGVERKNLEDLVVRLHLKKKVVFLGVIEPEDVKALLRTSHAMVLASEKEGRPNVVLEAMAIGTPVVAADIQSVRELIGSNERGLLFPPGDVEQLTARLLFLSKDNFAGRRLARRAHDWLDEQGLTWQKSAAAYSSVYRQVLDEYWKGKAGCAE